jgi:hypothetical protein
MSQTGIAIMGIVILAATAAYIVWMIKRKL